MGKRTTVKDIARVAEVSLGSVHCALNDKPGIGAATRERILKIAQELGYTPNAVAASLKRKNIRIAAVIPELAGENRFHYQAIWDGISDYALTMRDYNVELVKAPYSHSSTDSQAVQMRNLAERDDISGIVSVGYTPTEGIIHFRSPSDMHIPTVLVGNDLPHSGRICCVLPDYHMVGRTMAEQMVLNISRDEGILIFSGSPYIPSNYRIVEGITSYLTDITYSGEIHIYPTFPQHQSTDEDPLALFRKKKISGACAVTARTSAALGTLLEKLPGPERPYAIGVDLFDETTDFLKRGVFGNLVQNNPYRSAYLGTKILIGYLLEGKKPVKEVLNIGSEIVFRSNLKMYENGYDRLLL